MNERVYEVCWLACLAKWWYTLFGFVSSKSKNRILERRQFTSELMYRAVYAVIFLGQASGKILIILIEFGPQYREFRQYNETQKTVFKHLI